jgi:hypothetical protein
MNVMVKEFLISFRDYCYNETGHGKNEDYSDVAHMIMFSLGTMLYYFAFPCIVARIFYKSGIPIFSGVRGSLISTAFLGVLLLYPHVYITRSLLKRLSDRPINKNWSRQKLKDLRFIYVFFMLFGFIFMALVLWIADEAIDCLM